MEVGCYSCVCQAVGDWDTKSSIQHTITRVERWETRNWDIKLLRQRRVRWRHSSLTSKLPIIKTIRHVSKPSTVNVCDKFEMEVINYENPPMSINLPHRMQKDYDT